MGYTNYYYINKDNLANGIPKTYLDTMRKIKKRAKDNKVDMSFSRLNKNEVIIKGPGEWFTLESKPDQFYGDWALRFTKTHEYDYDPYVKVAIMAAIDEGLVTHWSFDWYADTPEDDLCFKDAVKIAAELGVKVAMPKLD